MPQVYSPTRQIRQDLAAAGVPDSMMQSSNAGTSLILSKGGAANSNNGATAPTTTSPAESNYTPTTGLETWLNQREQWLNDKNDAYLKEMGQAGDQYGGVIQKLISSLSAIPSTMNVGVGNMTPLTIASPGLISRTNLINQLAQDAYANQMNVPSNAWAWAQSNPLYTGRTNFLDYLGGPVMQTEGMRYQTPTATTNASLKSTPSTEQRINQFIDLWDKTFGTGGY